jgi:hypothetical protein
MMPIFSQLKSHYENFPLKWGIGFFVIGIIFDLFTLGRPDDLLNIIQQFIYLSILTYFYFLELKIKNDLPLSPFILKWWNYHELVAHFLYGSLLSAFTIFFIQSSSLIHSFIFLLLMFLILVMNELPQFQQKGPIARLCLLSLCWCCYLFLLVPIILGFMGWIPVFLSSLLFLSLVILLGKQLHFLHLEKIRKEFYFPSLTILISFILLLILGITPPVPLHLEKIGIYHQVEKKLPLYIGKYFREWWRFYESGAQTYYYKPGDPIFVLYSVFAPSRFEDDLIIHWLYETPNGLKSADKIPLKIKGGREKGYRGFSKKSSLSPGEWEIRIETIDSRIIGKINFEAIIGDYPESREDLY